MMKWEEKRGVKLLFPGEKRGEREISEDRITAHPSRKSRGGKYGAASYPSPILFCRRKEEGGRKKEGGSPCPVQSEKRLTPPAEQKLERGGRKGGRDLDVVAISSIF